MITCVINGKRAIPSLRGEIKLTKENPFVKSGGSYTYDVQFPMDIPENVMALGPMHRQDVSKRSGTFDECELYAGNLLLIRGRGTVTRVSESEVRLQIVSSAATSKFSEEFANVYIDNITYREVAAKYRETPVAVGDELNSKLFVGEEGLYVFQPTRVAGKVNSGPAATEAYVNMIARKEGAGLCLYHPSVQPSLLYVVRRVLECMGYAADLSAYDKKPWNMLYIANATRTLDMAKALPHWTAGTLLDEFRKLFNAVFIFDGEHKTVRVVPFSESENGEVEQVEPVEEFESNYDDDGIEYLGASNVAYSLSGNHRADASISMQVLKRYPVISIVEWTRRHDSMSERERMTTFVDMGNLGLGYLERQDDGTEMLREAGVFRPLFRSLESDTTVELKMAPVALTDPRDEFQFFTFGPSIDGVGSFGDHVTTKYVVLPILDEKPERTGDGYVSISEAINGEDPEGEEKEESETIELMFATSQYVCNTGSDTLHVPDLPKACTDYCLYNRNGQIASLSLNKRSGIYDSIGNLHDTAKSVDGNKELCFKFLYDGIPDPTKRYIIRNKLYLCSKIEAGITNEEGIDRLKTGYFYEILDQ